jgi:hypothetical protein
MKRKCTDCKHVFVTSKKDKKVLLESLKLIGIKSICCGKCLSFYIDIENERQTQHLRGY